MFKLVLISQTDNFVKEFPYGLSFTNTLRKDLLVFIDENGEVIRKKVWQTTGKELKDIIICHTSADKLILSGKMTYMDKRPTAVLPSYYHCIYQLDSLGNLVMQKENEYGEKMITLSTGEFLITSREVLTKLDSADNIVWQKKYDWNFFNNGVATKDGGWLISATHYDVSQYKKSYVSLCKYNNNGQVEWVKRIGNIDISGRGAILLLANNFSYFLKQNDNLFQFNEKGKNICLPHIDLKNKAGKNCNFAIPKQKTFHKVREVDLEEMELDVSLIPSQINFSMKDTVIHFQNSCGIKKIKSN
ncbi:MAG: hypothetical protein ACPG44_07395 [Polaribacter sp.]